MQHGVPEPSQKQPPPDQTLRPVLRVRLDGVLLSADPDSGRLLSEWNCEVGQTVPGYVQQAVKRALARNSPAEVDSRAGERDYSLLVVPMGECAYASVFIADVTEQKRAAAELRRRVEELETVMEIATAGTCVAGREEHETPLRQIQKLESIGVLAGGIAHDFNNLLVGVIGSASLAKDMLPPDSPVHELLQQIIKSGQQAAHLTKQMLAYSGHGRYVVEPVDLSDVVREVAQSLSSEAPGKIAILLNIDPGLPAIDADRSQMQQVLTNLLINATEAIGDEAGSVLVRTGEQHVEERFIQDGTEIVPGRYVFLEVRDTGCGMDETVKARIFDPFFTTKFQGRGLGLAAVAGIVRGHRGAIRVTTAPGRGTSFLLLFPVSDAEKPTFATDATDEHR